MACCAFAVMILMQLLAPIAWLKRRIWPGAHRPANPAAAWRLQTALATGPDLTPPAQSTALKPRLRRWIALAAGVELAVLIGLGAAVIPDRSDPSEPYGDGTWSDEEIWYEAMHDAWCRALGVKSPDS